MSRTISAFFVLVAWSAAPSPSWAIDCKKASSPSEKRVCGSPKLLALDARLNAAYGEVKKAVSKEDLDRIKEKQKDWARAAFASEAPQEDALAAAYSFRIDQLQLISGKAKVAETKSPVVQGDATLSYQWVQHEYNGRQIMAYPQLVSAKTSTYVAAINKAIKDEADSNEHDMIWCATDNTYAVYKYEVLAAKAGLFETQLTSNDDGCLCGCAHPSDETGPFSTLWDTETGSQVQPIDNVLLSAKPGSEDAFYAWMLANGNREYASLDDDCKAVYADGAGASGPSLDALHGQVSMTPGFPHATRACVLTFTVPIQSVASLLQVNPEPLKLLQREQEAGLVSAEEAAAIRKVVKQLSK